MPVSKKLIIIKDSKNFITTTYNQTFVDSINRLGRKAGSPNYDTMDSFLFQTLKDKKIKNLKKKAKERHDLDNYSKLNQFDYYITIRDIDKDQYIKLINKLRKADKAMIYLSLASWSMKESLHYHILIQSFLTTEEIEKRTKDFDTDIQTITDQEGLIGYFKKNLIADIIQVLNSDNKQRKIEIMEYTNILSASRNIIRPTIIKLPTDINISDIEELKDTEYLESKKYHNKNSIVEVDMFKDK